MSPSSSGPLLLGALLSSALTFVRTYSKPVLIGAVIFGTVAALIGGSVAYKAGTGFKGMMDGMGIDADEIQALSERVGNGDESAMDDMEKMLNDSVGSMENGVPAAMRSEMLGLFGPLLGVAALIGIIIAVFAHAYFLLLALSPTQNAMAVLRKTPALFLPLLGTWIWIGLRSFIWIPFLGIIPAIILGPRFALAPVILVKEKKGVMESVSESYSRTKGYWGKIVGNMIVACLCVVLASIVAGIAISIIGFMVPVASLWLQAIVKEVLSAFMIVFTVHLATTILANPMGGAKTAKKK